MKDYQEFIILPDGIHLSQYLDGELETYASEELTRSIGLNPMLRDEVEGLRDTIAVLNHMPSHQAPRRRHSCLENMPRRRFRPSQIGYWSDTARFPFEAAFNIVLMALLMALYLGVLPATDLEIEPAAKTPIDQGHK